MLWVVILIVIAVGILYLIQGAMVFGTDLDLSGFTEELEGYEGFVDMAKTLIASVYIILGLLTLIIAFLLYNGSKGGRTILIVILIISILVNAYALLIGGIIGIIELAAAIICLYILYQPPVKAYFKV
jgi:hypothetical protein